MASNIMDEYVKNVFSDKGANAPISIDEWVKGWVSIVGGVNGKPTAQMFNQVCYVFSYLINKNAADISGVTATANEALPKKDFTAAEIVALLSAYGLMTKCDADTVDGKHANAFAKADHSHLAKDISGILPISVGGTGGSNVADACNNLGAMRTSGGTFTGSIYFGSQDYYVSASGVANFARAYGAVYNDYAEFFPRGEETEPGDIIALDTNSTHERYIKATNTCTRIAGVHTNEYAMLIGGQVANDGEDYLEKNIKAYIPVALAGRVHVNVVGTVRTGDYIVPSEIPGVGRAIKSCEISKNGQIVGYAVESDDRTEIRKLLVRVGERG